MSLTGCSLDGRLKLLLVVETQERVGSSILHQALEMVVSQYAPEFSSWGIRGLMKDVILPSNSGYDDAVIGAVQEMRSFLQEVEDPKVVMAFGDLVSSVFTGRKANPVGRLVRVGDTLIIPMPDVLTITTNPELIPKLVENLIIALRLATDPFRGIPVVSADKDFLERNLSEILSADVIAYDTETSSLDPYSDSSFIIGVSLCWGDSKACFVPLEHTDLQLDFKEFEGRLELLKTILQSDTKKVSQNGKFDRAMLSQCLGVRVRGDYADTMLDHHILDENSSHSLTNMVTEYLPEYSGYDSLMNLAMQETHNCMVSIGLERIVGYACGDALVTYKLHHIFEEKLKTTGQLALARDIALPANLVYSKMEEAGVALDIPLMNEYIRAYGERMEELRKRLDSLPVVASWREDRLKDAKYLLWKEQLDVGRSKGNFTEHVYSTLRATPFRLDCLKKKVESYEEAAAFNPNSSVQVIKMYYDHCGLPLQVKYTKTAHGRGEERVSAGQEARESLLALTRTEENSAALALVELMSEYNKVGKLFSSFVRDYDKHLRDDGFIHTSFNQAVTRTGRLSNSSPNLQQVPKLTKAGEDEPEYKQWLAKHSIKRAYVSKFEDGLIINADYSQLELRLMASLSQDVRMVQAYLTGSDLHTETARGMFPDFDQVSDTLRGHYRDMGKTKNFASVYAMSPDFLEMYPGLGDWVEATKNSIAFNLFSCNPFGRRRHLPDLRVDTRGKMKQGVNAVIQSAGHDLLMRSLIRLNRAFEERELKSHLIFEVHDSIVVDCFAPEKDIVAKLMKEIMEDVSDLPWVKVPIVVDVEGGKTWGTAEPILLN